MILIHFLVRKRIIYIYCYLKQNRIKRKEKEEEIKENVCVLRKINGNVLVAERSKALH